MVSKIIGIIGKREIVVEKEPNFEIKN